MFFINLTLRDFAGDQTLDESHIVDVFGMRWEGGFRTAVIPVVKPALRNMDRLCPRRWDGGGDGPLFWGGRNAQSRGAFDPTHAAGAAILTKTLQETPRHRLYLYRPCTARFCTKDYEKLGEPSISKAKRKNDFEPQVCHPGFCVTACAHSVARYFSGIPYLSGVPGIVHSPTTLASN